MGSFIARTSKGRTVREFILECMLGPTAVTFVWLTVFERLPGSGVLSVLAVVVVALG